MFRVYVPEGPEVKGPACVDLKERFGRQFKVTYEESYYAEYGPDARTVDPWLMILVCQYGQIYPHGGDTLAASVDGHPIVAGQIRRLSCCRVHQDGDDGATVLFDVADFGQVAQIMHPRRRRQLSPEARQRLAEAGAKTRFVSGVQSQETARVRVSTTGVV